MIYDQYLTVRAWSENFCPSSDAIEKLVAWVRISGLAIKYYDKKVLSFIEYGIGKCWCKP